MIPRTHPKYFFLSLSLSVFFLIYLIFILILASSCNFKLQDSTPAAKERTVNKLILIMCMNSHTTLYISQSVVLLEGPTLADCTQ